MIGKKVHNAKGRGTSKAARIGSLVDYIRAPERALFDEKCVYYGGRGFVTDSPGGHRAEMVALAQDAVRSPDPVNHYVLSWREGEVPLPEQVEQAVSLFLDELELEGHQAVYGLHGDTDNFHLHVVVNRVHPATLRVVKIHGGFDLEAVHRAVARIEHAQGWMPEQRARYFVDDHGAVVRSTLELPDTRRPTQDKCDREVHSGTKSAERIAIDEAAPIIGRAKSWEELHVALADRGMRYERAGSGAHVFVGDTAVKASRVAREASFGSLEKRLGPYRSAPLHLACKALEPQPLVLNVPGWKQYNEQRARHYAEKRGAWQQLRDELKAERRALSERQRDRRAEVLSGGFQGRGHLLNSLRAALAQEQASEGSAMRRAHADARNQLRARHGQYPTLEQWLRARGQEGSAEQWRYRACVSQPDRPLAPLSEPAGSSKYREYVRAWDAQRQARRQAVDRLWTQYARDVTQLKAASTRRWSMVKVVSKGQVAGMLWAFNARAADQRAWRRLHERHREALRAAGQVGTQLSWSSSAATKQAGPTAELAPPGVRATVGLPLPTTPGERQRKGRSR